MVRLTLTIIVLVTISVFTDARSSHLRPNGRIIGGEKTTIEKNPWQVSLQAFGLHNCGGSIISPDTIITAAHCIDGLLSLFYIAVAGTSDLLNKEGVHIPVKEAIVHNGYQDLGNDVAILKLVTNLTFNEHIQPVKLAEEELEAEDPVTVTGWGILHDWDILSPNNLYGVDVNIVDRKQCASAYENVEGAYVDETMICAGVPNGGKDACSGDSGGPLTSNGTLYGIVSFGEGCGLADYPGVYTNVVAVREWIRKNAGV